jgi:hypothetical protein
VILKRVTGQVRFDSMPENIKKIQQCRVQMDYRRNIKTSNGTGRNTAIGVSHSVNILRNNNTSLGSRSPMQMLLGRIQNSAAGQRRLPSRSKSPNTDEMRGLTVYPGVGDYDVEKSISFI